MIVQHYLKKIYLKTLFNKIIYKKQYLQELNTKSFFFNKNIKNSLQNIKKFSNKMYITKQNNFLISYIIEFFFNKTNTLIQITNFFGKLKFFCSAGYLLFKSKSKKARMLVIKSIIRILIKKLAFLKNKTVILRLKNVGFKKALIVKKLKKKIFIKVIVSLNSYSHNGCRKKKNCRKKI
jgi:ribosomal protein S11